MSNLREVNVLLKRIRELEAELASMEPTVIRDLLARAEKAEATLQEKIAVGIEWFQRMTNAEARVAELVDEINRIIRHYKIEDYDLSVLEREAD